MDNININNVLSLFRLDGEVAYVTGAGRGLGKEIALGLAEAGADVAVADLNADDVKQTSEEIKKIGKNSVYLVGDVTSETDVESNVREAIERLGKITILVCNAGIVTWSPARPMPYEEWKKVIDVNLNGVFLYCKTVGREMIKNRKGSIINISSMSGFIVNVPQSQCHYNTSKAGVAHLTRSLAVEWAKHNIRVNALCPGYIMTPLLKEADKDLLKTWADICPQKRIPDPSELKGICVFLASKASSYFNGSCIIADGGYSLW
ncbi:MAG TPA: short-chain dehydrogenase [Actinobacteria bacterium]|nr:short-chain dehydrogenase [Actinomycetota bacterium]